MENFKAELFNKKASDPRNKPYQILEALKLQAGQNIVDIGSGGGYFSLRFAEAVGKEGQVFAVDTNKDFLEFVRNTAKKKGVNNIKTILVNGAGLSLPGKRLDLVFLRNVYHHLPKRVEYFRRLRGSLKPRGRIVIIEYKRGKLFSFRRIFGHYVPKEIIIDEMKEAGYQLMESFAFLPEQSFSIFSLIQ